MGLKTISEDQLLDLHGKVVILTGGNTGIGYYTIQMIARRGAKVYMASRNAAKASEAIERLKKENIGEGSVHWLEVDLLDPRFAVRAAEEFLKKEERLDILINNAGMQSGPPFKLTKDGLLDVMVINHISLFAFTRALLPLMKRTAAEPESDVRVINVSSVAHDRVAPDTFATKDAVNQNFGDTTMGRFQTYALTKLANILHVKALQTRLDEEGVRITCLAPHPGIIKTAGTDTAVRRIPYIGWVFKNVITTLFWDKAPKGAMVVAFAAAAPEVAAEVEKYKGAYLTPESLPAPFTPTESARDARLREELYETTENILRELGL